MLPVLANYFIHLTTALGLLAAFVRIYTLLTPFHEMELISKGFTAASLSFGGAMIGFALTLGSSIAHSASYSLFLVWGILAMVVQLMTYVVIARFIPHMESALAADNMAMGSLLGAISIAVGLINAGCIS